MLLHLPSLGPSLKTCSVGDENALCSRKRCSRRATSTSTGNVAVNCRQHQVYIYARFDSRSQGHAGCCSCRVFLCHWLDSIFSVANKYSTKEQQCHPFLINFFVWYSLRSWSWCINLWSYPTRKSHGHRATTLATGEL